MEKYQSNLLLRAICCAMFFMPLFSITAQAQACDEVCECDGGLTEMTLYYFGDANATVSVYGDLQQTQLIDQVAVANGDDFTVSALGLAGDIFPYYLYFNVDDGMGNECSTRIFSYCPSLIWPLSEEDLEIRGKKFGDLFVYSYSSEALVLCDLNDANIEQNWLVGGNLVGSDNNRLGTLNAEDLVVITANTEQARFTSTGELGINTNTPGATLDVDGDAIINSTLDVNGIARMNAADASTSPADGALIVAGGAGIGENLNVGNNATVANNADVGQDLGVGNDAAIGRNLLVGNDAAIIQTLSVGGDANVDNNLAVSVDASVGNDLNVGNDAFVNSRLGVNTTYIPADFQVAVEGHVICEELVVQLRDDWPDYVFDPAYQQPDIAEWRAFIAENKHLPGMPSAAEMEANGTVPVGESNRLLLEKIEELTLLLFQQQDQIEALRQQIENNQE